MLLVWFVGCELIIGCARSGETSARTAEGADEYGLDIVLLATSEFSMSVLN
jgi:hypothetical protein